MPQCLHLYKGTHLLPKLLIAVRHTARQTQATLPGNFAQNGEYLRWNERQEEHVPFLKWRVNPEKHRRNAAFAACLPL